MSCNKHPKYKGKKAPTNNCLTCLEFYATVTLRPRTPHKPTTAHRSKKRYSRNEKHKKSHDSEEK